MNPLDITISWLNWEVGHVEEQVQHCEKLHIPEKNNILGENQWKLEECFKPSFFSSWNLALIFLRVKERKNVVLHLIKHLIGWRKTCLGLEGKEKDQTTPLKWLKCL